MVFLSIFFYRFLKANSRKQCQILVEDGLDPREYGQEPVVSPLMSPDFLAICSPSVSWRSMLPEAPLVRWVGLGGFRPP